MLSRDGTPETWGPGVGLTIYRIVQEALTNTLKHAGPGVTVRIRIASTADGVEVEVVDDGARRADSPSTAGTTTGHGLAGIAERVAVYGGRAEAGPLPGDGWRVRARLSLTENRGGT